MKKSILISIVVAIMGFACSTTKLSKSGDTEKKFVSTFLSYLNHDTGPQYKEMMNCISPSYILLNNINTATYKVNNYAIWGFAIQSYAQRQHRVVVTICGEEKKWVHQLTFKLGKENGKLYLIPSKHSDTYIDPWDDVKTYVNQ